MKEEINFRGNKIEAMESLPGGQGALLLAPLTPAVFRPSSAPGARANRKDTAQLLTEVRSPHFGLAEPTFYTTLHCTALADI